LIRVLLADDQTLVRQGIRGLLEACADIQVVFEAADGEAALRGLTEASPDVALLDVRMPKLSGLDVVKRMQSEGRMIASILLTTFDDPGVLEEGMAAGIAGYLLKDVTRGQLERAIRTVAAGGRLIRPAVTERAARTLAAAPPPFPAAELPEPLTRRETEILRLIAAGLSNGEIAGRLGTAEGTVKNHTSHIFSKLGVRDRTRAVLKALEWGQL
jgi:DNA-binding NarL/FixJ family response regulator